MNFAHLNINNFVLKKFNFYKRILTIKLCIYNICILKSILILV